MSTKGRYWETIILLIILIITAFVYYPSLLNDFTYWDDLTHTVLNEDIRALDLAHLYKMFTSYYIGMYHPLTTLSFAVNYALNGYNPFIYHFTNYLFHLANIILAFLFVRMLTNKPFVALFTSLILAIHPMHVESIAWVTERKDVLYTFFYLLALIFYLLYTTKKAKQWYWLSLGAFLCSLLSKSAAVTLPLLLVLLDWYYTSKVVRSILNIEKLPFFILSVLFGIISLHSQNAGQHPYFHASFEWYDRPLLSSYAFIYYIVRYILPINLAAIHPFPTKRDNFLPLEYYLSPVFTIVTVALLFKRWKFSHEYRFGLFFFISTIALVLQIFPLGYAIVAERYAYVPYIGLSFFLGHIIDYIFKYKQKYRALTLATITVITVTFSYITFTRTHVWKDTLTLFLDASKSCPTEYAKNNMIAFAYKLQGEGLIALKEYKQAIAPLTISLRYNNDISETYRARAIAYMQINALDSAIGDLQRAIALDPHVPQYYRDLGTVYLKRREFQKAINYFTHAIALGFTNAFLYNDRGIAYLRTQQYEFAFHDFSTAISLDSSFAKAYANRGIVYIHLQQRDLACEDFKKAMNLGFEEVENLFKQYCK